ncbi:MAG: ketopantoate reductase family protein [Deltaproteobacteria bacterium]|nr:ketopantoate reductase family protein [Deltaproteobacteria bacterium]
MQAIKKAAILGAGAMGSFYASRFSDVGGCSTFLVARGERYERLKAGGLVVNGEPYAISVIHPDESNPPADLIIVALKHHHLPEAVNDLENLVGSRTTIISVMNGLDSEETIGSVYGMEKLLYAVAVGIDAVREGNRVIYTSPGKLYFGEAVNDHISRRVRNVQETLDRAGIPFETPPDMIRMMWWKFMVNVGMNQASAVMRAPYGVFQSSADARALMEDLMREVIVLAKGAGVSLEERDLDDWYPVLDTLSPLGKTSMLQDIESGRKTEVEMFGGRVVAMGETQGIPTPVNRTIVHAINVLEQYRDRHNGCT